MFRKSVILLIALFSLTILNCSSNDNEGTKSRTNNPGIRRLEIMKNKLDLNDNQVKEIEKIFKESRETFMKVREENMGDRSKMMERMHKMRIENDKKIEALLNEEQKKKFEEYKKERDERMQQRMGRRGGMQ